MTPVLPVVVDARIRYRAAIAPPGMTDALRARLRVPNPAYVAAERMDRAAYRIERWFCVVEEQGGEVSIPRGAMRHLRQVALHHGVRLRCEDRRTMPTSRLEIGRVPDLRDYQAKAVDELLRWHQGIFHKPAGSGKTTTAVGGIAALQTPALILVESLEIMEQWRKAIKDLLGVESGAIAGGVRDVQPVTVATVQSLARMDGDALGTLLGGVGLLVVDECHHAAAESYGRVIDRCPSRYRLGLSATPDREDGLGPVVRWRMGDMIATVSHDELITAGHLVAADIRELRTEYRYPYSGPDDWPKLVEDIVDDSARNRLILDAITTDACAGHTVLALTGRVAHAEYLAGELEARGIRAHALVGRVAKRRRAEILDAARAGEVQVIVATQLADEGLDIPRLSRVYQTYPARAAGRTEQRLGRVMRPHPDVTDVAIVDVVDPHVGVLAHQARRRRAVYERVLGHQSLSRGAA